MKKLIIIIALSAISSPAAASQGFFCSGPDGVEVDLPLGGGPGLNVLDATIKAAGGTWTTKPSEPGTTPMIPAQSASVDDRYYFDFADPDYTGIVASVRLFTARGGDSEPVFGGTLSIRDTGAWPITCGAG